MSGFTGHSTRASLPAGHKPRSVGSSKERTTRRHARDFSLTSVTPVDHVSLSGRPTSLGPDINKDLPRIPSPTPSHPLTPGSQNLRQITTTEAQDIAAQYLRRHGSSEVLRNEARCLPTLEVSGERTILIPGDYSREEHPSIDGDSDVWTFLPATPTIRRLFSWEVDMVPTSAAARRIPKEVNQDGTFTCRHEGCGNVLLTHKAFTSHINIHRIHDGLKFCELCGTRFIDEDHKDEHLNSCPKMPIFHDIESFSSEQPVSPLKNILCRLRP